jgi:hypothetical protein
MRSPGSLVDDGFSWYPETGGHRFYLEHTFGRDGPGERPLVLVALNPAANTPDGFRRSDTCRKAKLWAAPRSFDSVVYLNLFTALEVVSNVLHRAEALAEDAADEWFRRSAQRTSEPVIAAWGSRPSRIPRAVMAERVRHVQDLLGAPMVCLGLTRSGDPVHPRGWKSTADTQPFEPDPATGTMRASVPPPSGLLTRVEVVGRPASFATAHEAAWKALVREAITQDGGGPWPDQRFSVRLEFRTPSPARSSEVWDLDNLIKPTLDAMEGVFGAREWRGVPQPADDRVDHIDASKRTVRDGEAPGATIEVRSI